MAAETIFHPLLLDRFLFARVLRNLDEISLIDIACHEGPIGQFAREAVGHPTDGKPILTYILQSPKKEEMLQKILKYGCEYNRADITWFVLDSGYVSNEKDDVDPWNQTCSQRISSRYKLLPDGGISKKYPKPIPVAPRYRLKGSDLHTLEPVEFEMFFENRDFAYGDIDSKIFLRRPLLLRSELVKCFRAALEAGSIKSARAIIKYAKIKKSDVSINMLHSIRDISTVDMLVEKNG